MTDTTEDTDTAETATLINDDEIEAIRRDAEAHVQRFAATGQQREQLVRTIGESMAATIATATAKANADCVVNLTAQIQTLETQAEALRAELTGANKARGALQAEAMRTRKAASVRIAAARADAKKAVEEAVQVSTILVAKEKIPIQGVRMLVSSASDGGWFAGERVRPELAEWFDKLKSFAENGDLPAGWRRIGRQLIAPNGDQHLVDSHGEAIVLARELEADEKARLAAAKVDSASAPDVGGRRV